MKNLSTQMKIFSLAKYEGSRAVKKIISSLKGKKLSTQGLIKQFSGLDGKRLVLKNGFGFSETGLSWFYTAFDREEQDPLTNRALHWILRNIPKEEKILLTGCGCGIMAFHLAENGFENLEGRDLLSDCVKVANEIKEKYDYKNITFLIDDGFQPVFQPDQKYSVITAMHWVFSAWMGNYGNAPTADPYDKITRKRLLCEFLDLYVPQLLPGGVLIIELTDAVADYRDPLDHPAQNESTAIYPVRHTPEMVQECAKERGMTVIDKWLCISYGHQPRTAYYLKK